MILGFVSDAHGNDTGLERCLDVLRQAGAERVYFLGDSVGYMPREDAVLNRLAASDVVCIRGNHEEMLLGNRPFSAAQDEVYRLGEVRARLSPKWLSWIQAWPIQREVVIDDSRLLLVHGSPLDPVAGYVYPDTDLAGFQGLPYDVVVLGHTHRPFIRTIGTMTVVNVGSCGLPRDVGTLASCGIYDTAARSAEILRVEFDAQSLAATLGNRVHRSVIECLGRQHAGPIVGRVIHV